MKKKLRILFLALLVIWSLSVPALAAELGGPVYVAGSTYYDSANKAFLYYVDGSSGQTIYSSVADGMITAQAVAVKADAGVAFEVYLDGERIENMSGGPFQEPGEYVVMYMGGAVSERIFSFTIVPEQCNYVTGYKLPMGFEMVNATLNDEPVAFDRDYIKLAVLCVPRIVYTFAYAAISMNMHSEHISSHQLYHHKIPHGHIVSSAINIFRHILYRKAESEILSSVQHFCLIVYIQHTLLLLDESDSRR